MELVAVAVALLLLVGVGIWLFVTALLKASTKRAIEKGKQDVADAKARMRFWKTMGSTERAASLEAARARTAERRARLERLREAAARRRRDADLP